ncbi:MAG: HDOD domain-containing protein [Desulfobacteraceae bacterium]|nr:HDOD domain-containing protein [Desulfobacteraceae bacterium]
MNITDRISDLIRSKHTQLPTLPVIIQKIMDVVSDEDSSASQLSEVIKKDQAISNKILRLANSAYFGFPTTVDSVGHAVALIGFNEITGIVIGMSVMKVFKTQNPKHMDMDALWTHAIGCGNAAKHISKMLSVDFEENLFLAGLLHDIGKIFFIEYFPDEYQRVLTETAQTGRALHEVEYDLMGINHAQIAGKLMNQWNFPDTLVVPCSYHHDTTGCPEDHHRSARIIQYANYLCHISGLGSSGNPLIEDNLDTRNELGFGKNDEDTMKMHLYSQVDNIQRFLQVIS